MALPAALLGVAANWRKAVPFIIAAVACFLLWLLFDGIRDAWRGSMEAAAERGRQEIRADNLRLRAEAAEARNEALRVQLEEAQKRATAAADAVEVIRRQRDRELAVIAKHDLRKLLNAKPKLIEARANAATAEVLQDFAATFED